MLYDVLTNFIVSPLDASQLGFLTEDFKVVATARTPSSATELNALAASTNGRVEVLPLDIDDEASADAFVAALTEKYGKVDFVIYNAGVSGTFSTPKAVSKTDLVNTFTTNAFAPISLTDKMLPLLKASKDPRAVYVSTMMSSLALVNNSVMPSYRASKVALNMLVRTLAQDVPEVAFMLVHPGWVKTAMGGENAPVLPDDSAAGILATAAKFCTKEHSADALYTFEGTTMPW